MQMKKNRKLYVKLIAIVQVWVLFIGAGVSARAHEIDKESGFLTEETQNTSEQTVFCLEEPLPMLLEEEPVESAMGGYVSMFAAIPEEYDLRGENVITPIKRQGSYGTCWAFSVLSMLETNSVMNNILTLQEADLSERHLAYYTYYPVADPLGGTTANETVYHSGDMSFLRLGGNLSMACHRLANWQGAVYESFAPYEDVETALPATQAAAYENNAALIKSYYVYSKDDTELIKKAIMEYGQVGLSYYVPQIYDAYYNEETFGYYYTGNVSGTNHAVVAVGWDDNFQAENFKTNPGTDGAWLIKNSWGEEFGDDGYFWLSYADPNIGNNMYAVEALDVDEYDNNYQYDGTILDDAISPGAGEIKIANVFQAKANATGAEELTAVSFNTYTTNLEYSVQVYTDLQDAGNPESGLAMLEQPVEGVTISAGQYMVPLESAVQLAEGQTFSVVITLKKENAKIYVYTEATRAYGYDSMQSTAKANEGESFIWFNIWDDFGKTYDKNIRIKAYTKNVSGASIPIPVPSATPTAVATPAPTQVPTAEPTAVPTARPTAVPTMAPTAVPTARPTAVPTVAPTVVPTVKPTAAPSATVKPTESVTPSATPTVSKEFPFEDVKVNPGNWKYEAVKYVYENGIMNGVGVGSFQPDAPLTRAMFTTMLYRMAGSPAVEFENKYSDVPGNKWYSKAVTWASEQGIVNGYSETIFKPDDNITREQIAKMLRVYARMQGEDVNTNVELSAFADGQKVSKWAEEYVKWAVGAGMLNGSVKDGKYYLRPKDNATRAESAAILSRFMQK